MTKSAQDIIVALHAVATAKTKKNYMRFFKKKWIAHDEFLGVSMPMQRAIAKEHLTVSLSVVKELLESAVHEHRMTALLILLYKYESGEDVVSFYLKHLKTVDNWDFVDVSAPGILGVYLLDHDRSVLYRLVKSQNIWERRIAIVSTLTLIRKGDFVDALQLSELLLSDEEDLIHKAVGWMLREVGKKNVSVLERFLEEHATLMPRVTLRYCIERFDEKKRQHYLKR